MSWHCGKREHVQKMDPKFTVFGDAEIVVSLQCHTHFYKKKHVVLRARFSVRRDVCMLYDLYMYVFTHVQHIHLQLTH